MSPGADGQIVPAAGAIPVRVPVKWPIAVEVAAVFVGAALVAVGTGVAIRIESPQEVQSNLLRNNHRSVPQVGAEGVGQEDRLPLVAAVDSGHDEQLARPRAETENLEREAGDRCANDDGDTFRRGGRAGQGGGRPALDRLARVRRLL